MEWYVFAIGTMILFAFSNIAMKEMMRADFNELFEKNQQVLLPFGIIVALAVIALFVFVFTKAYLPQNVLFPALGFMTAASIGLVLLLLASKTGQIAAVVGVVSASSALTAILSVIILKDVLNAQQIGGIALATLGVLAIIFAK